MVGFQEKGVRKGGGSERGGGSWHNFLPLASCCEENSPIFTNPDSSPTLQYSYLKGLSA